MESMFFGTTIFQILFSLIFFVIFILFIVVFVVAIAKGITNNKKNNESPRLSVQATVVTKRADVRGMDRNITDYYVTFQVESGDRMELEVKGEEYGMLVEGDQGRLTFQGTRYLSFQR